MLTKGIKAITDHPGLISASCNLLAARKAWIAMVINQDKNTSEVPYKKYAAKIPKKVTTELRTI